MSIKSECTGLDLCLVWLKKDLRLTDHQPLQQALRLAKVNSCPVVLLYLVEPALLDQPDIAAQHHAFAMECLLELAGNAKNLNLPLLLVKGDSVEVFSRIAGFQRKVCIFSHQETGNLKSFERDKQVAKRLKDLGLSWHQFQSNGVVRGSLDRDQWSAHWHKAMDRQHYALEADSLVPGISSLDGVVKAFSGMEWIDLSQKAFLPEWADCRRLFPEANQDKANRQKGGRKAAEFWLAEFLTHRGKHYRSEMSSPLSAETACSRISPYLAFGVLSVREVLTALDQKRISLTSSQSALSREDQAAWRKSLKSFESRLHWHCHFIQKLESEPELEKVAAHRQLDRMRVNDLDVDEQDRRLQAWISGQTGVPMIDACMRMLKDTGWVNFRMRAMLVAFASYQLWLDWRLTAPLLAREFLDYEPGIHYPQFQMQSGVTGINTLRIYNPVKQARDRDPDGLFIRRWTPELARVPDSWLAEPWNMPRLEAEAHGFELGKDYPLPVVDPTEAVWEARARIALYRRAEGFEKEASRVYQKHGSRHPNRNGDLNKSAKLAKAGANSKATGSGSGEGALQLGLFDEQTEQ